MNTNLGTQARTHLEEKILPFWMRLKDEINGGFYGRVDYNLTCFKKSTKGNVQTCRLIYFFSEAALALESEELATYADHAFRFLLAHGFDNRFGGLFWSLAYDGLVEDSIKSSFCFAYGILALTSYWQLRKNEQALALATQLYELIETHFADEVGYKEVLCQDFSTDPNTAKLFAKGSYGGAKTMNTLLHLLDAYQSLYAISKDDELLVKIEEILSLFANRVFDTSDNSLVIYFDQQMQRANTYRSYGHEIEASWMLERVVKNLPESALTRRILEICDLLANQVYRDAFTEQSVMDEIYDETVQNRRVHWVQAEAILGFMAAYARNESQAHYKDAAEAIWQFVQTHLVDKREMGEWLYRVDVSGEVNEPHAVVWPWKGPYNNGRMCLLLMQGTENG